MYRFPHDNIFLSPANAHINFKITEVHARIPTTVEGVFLSTKLKSLLIIYYTALYLSFVLIFYALWNCKLSHLLSKTVFRKSRSLINKASNIFMIFQNCRAHSIELYEHELVSVPVSIPRWQELHL